MSGEKIHDTNSLLFTQLVMSFHAAAWQQLGKVANPISGKIERNLELAKNSIDILGMLEEKTRGNINEDEEKSLQQILTQLRMNFVEESGKPQPEEKDDGQGKEEEEPGPDEADKDSEDDKN
ncbi:MAG: DUF1844 domain-containing protein [candidate division Zixibacteria bacterium]|nr:DUF1844 domain-containing protein [candidate division Zixibacteria bacterium]